MRTLTVVSGVRVFVAAIVAAAGLVASAPQVHGTVQTRGAVACNVNIIGTPNCGAKADYMTCITTYTKCNSYPGPKNKICTLNANSSCKANNECILQNDYSWSTNCTPVYFTPGVTGGPAPRRSQLQ